MTDPTTTTTDPNSVIAHAAAHGLGSVWPELVVLGVVILALMVFVEWKRQARRRT